MRPFYIIACLLALVTACSPAATPAPTTEGVALNDVVSPTPPDATDMPTAIPTRAPLPTAIPTDDTPSLSDVALSGRAKIRTVHASPNLPRVDVYLGGQVAGFSMDYGEATGKADVVAGDYVFRLLESGARPDDPELLQQGVNLENGDELVALVMPDEDVIVVEENLDSLTGEQSRVQVIHLIPDAPDTTIVDDANTELFNAISYGEVSTGVIFEPGDTLITFENILEDYAVTLRPRRTYTFVLYGTPEDPDVIAYDFAAPSRAEVLFVNLADEIGEVDVYLNGEPFSENVGFENSDSLNNLPVNTYDVAVYESGSDPTAISPLLENRLLLNPDDEVFALLMGTAADLRLVTYQEPDDMTGADETRLTFISAVSGVPQLEELHNDDLNLAINYAQPTTLTLPSNVYNFEFATDVTENDYTSVASVDRQEFEEGVSYLFLITRSPDTINTDPVRFERVVGAREPEPDPNATPPPQEPIFYFVNALDRPLEVTIDNELVAEAVLPGESTDLLTTIGGAYTIAIADAETREFLYETNRVLVQDGEYTLVFFGDLERQNYAMADFTWELSGPAFETQNGAILRLVNVNLSTGQQLATGYTFAALPEDRPTNIRATRQAEGITGEPLPLPAGVTGFTNTAVSSGAASEAVVIPSGPTDLYAYNISSRNTTTILFDVELEAQRRYDFIITSQPGEPELTGILSVFPLP